MRELRYNTAVIVSVGPFYDRSDGVTIETALTITNERITLVADTDAGSAPTNILDNVTGATSGTDNDLNYITGNDAGMMQLELSAANTARLGRCLLSITDAANHVPVVHEFMIITESEFDRKYAITGPVPDQGIVDRGTAQSATATTLVGRAAGAFADDTIIGCLLGAYGSTQAYWQFRVITDVTLSSDTFTVDAWTVTPSGTITYVIYAGAPGSTSLPIPVDVVQVSGDATAAANLESFLDGTGYAGTGNTIPTVTDLTTKTGFRLSSTGVDDILRTALTEAYATDGSAGTLSQILYGIQAFLQEKSVSGTTLTVKKLDGSTTAMTFTLSDASNPTSLTRAS